MASSDLKISIMLPTNDTEQYHYYTIKRAKELSKFFSFISKRESIDRLVSKRRLTQEQGNFIKKLWEVSEEVYPGRVDIQYRLKEDIKSITNTYGSNHVRQFSSFDKFSISRIFLVIFFPEITIKNQSNLSLTIKDIIVRVPIKIEDNINPIWNCPQATRSSVTSAELVGLFIHSHISSSDLREERYQLEFHEFCMGSSDLLSVISILSGTPYTTIDYDMVRLLLLQIEQFISWEDEEGGPYRHIRNIVLSELPPNNIGERDCQVIFTNIQESIRTQRNIYSISPQIDWRLQNGRYEIVDNEKFEDFLLNSGTIPSGYLAFKDERGEYYVLNRRPIPPREITSNKWIPFRGNKLKFSVTHEENIRTGTDKKYVIPKLKYYVKHKLEFKINELKIKESELARISTSYSS